MVAFPFRQRLTSGASSPAIAILVAAFLAGVATFLPAAPIEQLARTSGLAALVPAAAPALGDTMRLVLVIVVALGGGMVAWVATGLLAGGRKPPFLPDDLQLELPILRRADIHPDAPARAPLRAARDLGTPFLDPKPPRPPVERDLPRDLDTPLSAFDPAALPSLPAAPIPLVASLVRPAPTLASGERFESFELPAPIAAPRTDATIHALLDRLEAGVGRRARARPGPLDETLGELRRMTARG